LEELPVTVITVEKLTLKFGSTSSCETTHCHHTAWHSISEGSEQD